MEVVLLSGSVELAYSGRTMLLEPGEKAVVLKQHGEIVRQQHSDPNLLAWKTRKLQFDNTPLGQIVEKLESVYHKEIVLLNPGIENCRITATFDGESLEAVLRVLQSTIDITARPNGDTIELSGAGCQ
jgi:ferric-dicitrate binding protein FerR (iron transport regulator)